MPLVRGSLVALNIAAGALLALEVIGWFVGLANAAGEAARKIEEETVKALEKVRDAASGFQAQAAEVTYLADCYFE